MANKPVKRVLGAYFCDIAASALFIPLVILAIRFGLEKKVTHFELASLDGLGFWASIGIIYVLIGPVVSSASDYLGRITVLKFCYLSNGLSFLVALLAWRLEDWWFFLLAIYLNQIGQATTPIMVAIMGDYYEGTKRFSAALRVLMLWSPQVSLSVLLAYALEKHPAHLLEAGSYCLCACVFLECMAFFLLFFHKRIGQLQEKIINIPLYLKNLGQCFEDSRLNYLCLAGFVLHLSWVLYAQSLDTLLGQEGLTMYSPHVLITLRGIAFLISLGVTAGLWVRFWKPHSIYRVSAILVLISLIFLGVSSGAWLFLGALLVAISIGNVLGYFWFVALELISEKRKGAYMGIVSAATLIAWALSGYIAWAINGDVASLVTLHWVLVLVVVFFFVSLLIMQYKVKNI